MVYPIKCANFKQAIFVSNKFGELYSKEKRHRINGRDGSIGVQTGEHLFIFFYKGKREGSINVEDFAKKYFTQK